MTRLSSSNARRDWWQHGNFYQIYPRSFKDSDGDGVGDLNGISSKLPYLRDIGMTGVWLSPIFQSPMLDFGYDISNYTNIHYEYGTLEDFDNLVKRCKQLGIKLILDFVPNHTSSSHPWFALSEAGDEYYKDFYVWHPGKINETGERCPPSNWVSLFRYSAWQWSEKRQEYYLHQCLPQQPDLNFRNPNVVNEMNNVMKFWLQKGVDGFRIDAIPHVFETINDDGSYPDEPPSGKCDDPTQSCYYNHIYTKDLDETYDLVYQWHDLMEEWKSHNGGETRILMAEAYASLQKKIEYYGNGYRYGAQVPFNFEIMDNIKSNSTPDDYKECIDDWMDAMPKDSYIVPNWLVGNHDQHRVVNRFGLYRADALNIMVQVLPGIAITYYGEELGMTDQWISWNDTVDPQACNQDPDTYDAVSRDPARTPFQWDTTKNAGFSTAYKTWLPVSSSYKTVNVKSETMDLDSHLNVFRRLTRLRKNRLVLQEGSLETVADGNLLIIKREIPGTSQLFAVLNFGSNDQEIVIEDYFGTYKRNIVASVVSNNAQIRRGKLFHVSDIINIPRDAGVVFE